MKSKDCTIKSKALCFRLLDVLRNLLFILGTLTPFYHDKASFFLLGGSFVVARAAGADTPLFSAPFLYHHDKIEPPASLELSTDVAQIGVGSIKESIPSTNVDGDDEHADISLMFASTNYIIGSNHELWNRPVADLEYIQYSFKVDDCGATRTRQKCPDKFYLSVFTRSDATSHEYFDCRFDFIPAVTSTTTNGGDAEEAEWATVRFDLNTVALSLSTSPTSTSKCPVDATTLQDAATSNYVLGTVEDYPANYGHIFSLNIGDASSLDTNELIGYFDDIVVKLRGEDSHRFDLRAEEPRYVNATSGDEGHDGPGYMLPPFKSSEAATVLDASFLPGQKLFDDEGNYDERFFDTSNSHILSGNDITEVGYDTSRLVQAITDAPTLSPSDLPSDAPISPTTNSPTRKPTRPPVRPPTRPPTRKPSPSPTATRTSPPTKNPTRAPVNPPTPKPTEAKIIQTTTFVKRDCGCADTNVIQDETNKQVGVGETVIIGSQCVDDGLCLSGTSPGIARALQAENAQSITYIIQITQIATDPDTILEPSEIINIFNSKAESIAAAVSQRTGTDFSAGDPVREIEAPSAAPSKSPAPSTSQMPTLSLSPTRKYEPSARPTASPQPTSAPTTRASRTFQIISSFDFDDSKRDFCLNAMKIKVGRKLKMRPCRDGFRKQLWFLDDFNQLRLRKRPNFCITRVKRDIFLGKCADDSSTRRTRFFYDKSRGFVLVKKRKRTLYLGLVPSDKYGPVRMFTEGQNNSLNKWFLF